jgi:hypothetical protein
MATDGIGYWHRVTDREGERVARWSNPDARKHLSQVALINAYRDLLRHLSLYPE